LRLPIQFSQSEGACSEPAINKDRRLAIKRPDRLSDHSPPFPQGRNRLPKRELVPTAHDSGTRVDLTRSQFCQVAFSSSKSHLQESAGGHAYSDSALMHHLPPHTGRRNL